ncbi:MAG: potassium transporter TrkG, partial [Pseudomonadota bacterium]
ASLIVLLPLALALAALFAGHVFTALSFLAVGQGVVLLLLIARGRLVRELLGYFYGNPAVFLSFSFGSVILLGTLLLSFPASSASGVRIAPMDALFTSASAVCVTGLIVLDTPTAFSAFGQAVILLLIQVGGLGIMVLSAFAALSLGRSLGLKTAFALQDILDASGRRTAQHLARFIVVSTLSIELVGAALLAAVFFTHGAPLSEALWNGVFHSISAFCNAGFALQTDSIVMFQHEPAALFVFGFLVIAGGLGFAVLAAAWLKITAWKTRGLPLQVKVVATATLLLVVAAWIVFAALEWNGALGGMSVPDKIANAFFQGVTPRTAGFNSVDMGLLGPATCLVFILLMFIGASPGGTGGGIKVTTLAVLLATIPAVARGAAHPVLFRRAVPHSIVYKCVAITAVAVLTIACALAGLLLTQDMPFDRVLFETVSAFGTVGLSLGATSALNDFGKFIIVAVMFVGRVGPLTVALLLESKEQSRLDYPREMISVG